jgi:hypothetical protein
MTPISSLRFFFGLLVCNLLHAGGPEQGSLTVELDSQPITSIDIKYNISQLMGDPTVLAVYRWHSDKIKEIRSGATLWLKVTSTSGHSWGYIECRPTVPDEGEWAMDTTGSPSWDKVIVKSFSNNHADEYWPARDAKLFWKEGFTVTDALFNYSIK